MSRDIPPDNLPPGNPPHARNAPPPVSRYAPDVPLPAARFVPGEGPRPTFDFALRGALHGVASPHAAAPLCAANWRNNTRFLFACDLFNHGYFWEAHEAWEELWHEVTEARTRDLLQTLILIAAAHLKDRIGAERIATILRGRAAARRRGVGEGHALGVDSAWIERQCREGPATSDEPAPCLVLRLTW